MTDDKSFVDTNVLVYAHDRGAGRKHEIAKALVENLWRQRKGVISIQVLQEFYVNVRRKALNPVRPKEAKQLLADYMSWEVVINDGESLLQAVETETRYKISFWDALIVQAANAAGATVLYSEDLSHDQRYGATRVNNPFIKLGA
jgi:predicted nucleic acid-binding protein